MTMDDADFMLSLKNDPQTREFAIASNEEIKREDHIKWLEKNIQYFQVVEEENASYQILLGAVRIQDFEISIWVDRPFWGRGIATEMIKRVAEDKMTAKIVNGNVASFRVFIAAGFSPIKYVDNYYILQK